MNTNIRRLERLEERLAISDKPKIEIMFVRLVSPGPNGPVADVQAARLNGTIVYRGKDETLEDFESRIKESLPPQPGRIPVVIVGMPEHFNDDEPVRMQFNNDELRS
jgi:hypothetical protein